jgi:hypothetical protein
MNTFEYKFLRLKNLFALLLLLIVNTSLAQELAKQESKLTPQVKEEYEVLKANYSTREGVYAAYFKKKMLAAGRYRQNKKIGNWTFFDPRGRVIQRFNYDNSALLYEAPEDTTSGFMYLIDKIITDTDRVTKPVKPGGRYYGYLRYLNLFKLPDDLIGINNDDFRFTVILLVSPYGRLAEYKVHIQSLIKPDETQDIRMNINLLSEEEKTFLPAIFNKEPVSSTITIQCRLIGSNRLTFRDM